MLKRLATAVCLLAAVAAFVATPRAQEGYPMTGTWYGDYGTGAQKKDVTFVMQWDGSKASGTMRCGNGTIRAPHPVELFGEDWFETELKTAPRPSPSRRCEQRK